jgi:hypothetical protein
MDAERGPSAVALGGNYTVDHVLALGEECDCLMAVRCWARLMAVVAGSSKSTCTLLDTFTSLLWV